MTFLLVLKKVWAWLKKWGLWLLGGILALGGIVIAVKELTDDDGPTEPPEDFSDDGEKLADELADAAEERNAQLTALRIKHQERLEQASDEERKELEELKDKPLEEVVAWFDKL